MEMPKGRLFAVLLLALSAFFYFMPFAFIVFLSNLFPRLLAEWSCWLFFIPAFLLPYYYGSKGVRLVGVFTVLVLGMMYYLFTFNRTMSTHLLHWLLTLFTTTAIAFWVGIFVERFSRSAADAREQNLQLKSLFAASELFAFSLDPQEVLNQSPEIIRETLGFDNADIWLLEGENSLRLAASNLPPVFGAPDTFPADRCLPGLALSSGEGVFIEEPLIDERIENKAWLNQLKYRSSAALPLIHRGEKLGVLIVSSMKKYKFTSERRELLRTFVNQLSLHIKNAMLYREVQQQAIIDEATGLYNHRHLNEYLDKETKRVDREGGQLSLLMLDLNYFKDYNDMYGHPSGDLLLREFGEVLRAAVRETDVTVRYGGDEFAVVLPQTDGLGAEQLSARVLEQLNEHRFSGFEKIVGGVLTVSIGRSTYPDPAKSKVELIKLADDQLYRMKELWREARKISSLGNNHIQEKINSTG
ncbi:MAG: sensor domain-containing diguanylate cyclase [Dethiobacter sp.]|nr:sensor domain-containing diguanylate cyclase [Dethiobacter sp.]MCL4463175.1 sensor domain-containing diguanylate cyclase [Bacillota bacterium]